MSRYEGQKPKDVRLSKSAAKEVLVLPQSVKDAIKEALNDRSSNPLLGKALKGPFRAFAAMPLVTTASHTLSRSFTPTTIKVAHIKHRRELYRRR